MQFLVRAPADGRSIDTFTATWISNTRCIEVYGGKTVVRGPYANTWRLFLIDNTIPDDQERDNPTTAGVQAILQSLVEDAFRAVDFSNL